MFFTKFLLISLIILSTGFSFESPFESTVEGLTINNSHYLDHDKLVIRGMAPNSKFDELVNFGIKNVLIFKNQTKNEVDKEIVLLEENQINYQQIDFKWRDIKNFKNSCIQVLNGIQFLKQGINKQEKTFFHCTVGEDRTGVLSGIFELLTNPESNILKVFKHKMCKRGFADGNKQKPSFVVNKIHQSLTPLYFAMADVIKENRINLHNFESNMENICQQTEEKIFNHEYQKVKKCPKE